MTWELNDETGNWRYVDAVILNNDEEENDFLGHLNK